MELFYGNSDGDVVRLSPEESGHCVRVLRHRLGDEIFVIDGGRLIEEGTHAELMARGGKYAELFTTQAKRYLETQTENETKEDK